MPSAVSSSSHFAIADKGRASCQTWFAKGRPDSAKGLSAVLSPQGRVLYFVEGCV